MKSPTAPANSVSASQGERNLYSSITIEGFRHFQRLELNNLGRINLFLGQNNCGKTSILEAIYTHACGLSFAPVFTEVVVNRNNNAVSGVLDIGEKLFSLFQDTSSLPYSFTISAQLTGEITTQTVKSTFHPSSELSDLDPRSLGQAFMNLNATPPAHILLDRMPSNLIQDSPRFLGKWQTNFNDKILELDLNFPLVNLPSIPFKLAAFHDIITHRNMGDDIRVFSSLKRYGILPKFTEEMKAAFPEVCEIDIIPYPDGTQSPVFIATADTRRLPLYAFGDGVRRWFYLLGQMLAFQNAVHCIEEIDSTFHPSSQGKFIKLLIKYAHDFNNQLFLTSHSIEFVDALLESLYGENGTIAPGDEDPVRVFSIKRSPDTEVTEVWNFTGRIAYESRELFKLELRG